MADDAVFTGGGDLDAARSLAASAEDAELFVYPGRAHLFADPGLPDHDEAAARVLTARTLRFLDRVAPLSSG